MDIWMKIKSNTVVFQDVMVDMKLRDVMLSDTHTEKGN